MDNLNFILPEIFISLSIMFLLLLGVYKKNSSNIVHNLAVGSLLITGILIFNNSLDQNILLYTLRRTAPHTVLSTYTTLSTHPPTDDTRIDAHAV